MDNLDATELASQLATARAELRRLKSQAAAVARQADRNRRLADLGAVAQRYGSRKFPRCDEVALLRMQEHI